MKDEHLSERLGIRIEKEYLAEIDELIKQARNLTTFRVNRSQMARRLIIEGLKNFKEGKTSF